MARSKGRPVNMPGLNKCTHFGAKSRITGMPINLAGSGMPMHQQTSRPHKNRDKFEVSVEKGIVKMPLTNHTSRFPHLDLDCDGSYVQKRFHSGRTDSAYGHHVFTNPTNNRGEALGTYHFHYTQGPHIPCCRTGTNQQAASIINPYTGREIALGEPYIFEGQGYFSLNLVAQALTIDDTVGVTLDSRNETGSFRVCNFGLSSSERLGTLRVFRYPTNFLGRPSNNTRFDTACRSIVLLCHTRQAPLDTIPCYAYIGMESLSDYMLGGGFFTIFAPHMPSNVWHFTQSVPLIGITAPNDNENFHVGDTLSVRAVLQDVREATLTINGRIVEEKTGLSGREIVFAGHQLTESDTGSLMVGVNARNGQSIAINLPSVRVNVSAIPIPNVRILSPNNGDAFTTDNSVEVEVEVENATQSELTIGNHRQTVVHTMGQQHIRFDPYTLISDDVVNADVSVTAHNEYGMTASDSVQIRVKNWHVTMDMMQDFRWQATSLTDAYIDKINSTLEFYGITDLNSIRLFFATCGHESGKGRTRLEQLNADGSTVGDYSPNERGAGYIQITHRNTHLAFLASIGDSFIGENTAEYIAQNYPWEAAAWFWTSTRFANIRPSLRLWPDITLDMFTRELGDSLSIFLLTQYAVNGWGNVTWGDERYRGLAPSDYAAKAILEGTNWHVDDGRLRIVDVEEDPRMPVGWADRYDNFNEAISIFR